MTEQQKPNVILILADDMGFADLGVTGSEIRTPNINALAQGGVLLSSMYNCARCCPTRASLLTGLYPHNAGIGHMGANLGTPAYQGFLRNDSATIAEHLRANGYRTLMSGKWHVAGDFEARNYDSWRVGDVEHPTPVNAALIISMGSWMEPRISSRPTTCSKMTVALKQSPMISTSRTRSRTRQSG